jgi:hypothetical protein
MAMLGPNPTQERFRLATYDLAFQASGAELLAWGEFMELYTAMYPRGQPSRDESGVNNFCIRSDPNPNFADMEKSF